MDCEARPLAEALDLSPAPDCSPFRLFVGEGVRLCVGGIGAQAAAAAVGYLFALGESERHQAWLNIGVAGHRDLPPGTLRLAHKVEDGQGFACFPPRVLGPTTTLGRLDTATVRSVSQIETEYREPALYEMEAAAFCATALRLTIAELVVVLKVVSDNPHAPVARLTTTRISELLAGHRQTLAPAVMELYALCSAERALWADPDELEAFVGRWHFTATERHRLSGLLRRWQARWPARSALGEVSAFKDKDAVLVALQQSLGVPMDLCVDSGGDGD
jgi:hypothetical protein